MSGAAPSAEGEGSGGQIRDVWASNLQQEINVIQNLIDKYPYVAMDTEFPGILVRPVTTFKTTADFHYQSMKTNVDMLKIIQLGITLSDQNGAFPPDCCTWQFHFKFSLSDDIYAQESIDLLARSGVDFRKHEEQGIDTHEFGALFMMSGVVLNDNVKWISFHSGYDFAYLLKVLSCQPLPDDDSEFFELLRLFFPCLFDLKHMMRSCQSLRGGLQQLADDLKVARIGPQHQAGSDSLLTCMAFFKMRNVYFENKIDEEKYSMQIYGLAPSLKFRK
jgi:CCR4-NOT transcription complex subunit 7/8